MRRPTIHDALRALGCTGGWKLKDGEISGWACETPQPSDEAIQAKLKELQTEYETNQYQRDRASVYPSIQEQLDMQYWDAVNGTKKWQEAVAKVKTDNPKPE